MRVSPEAELRGHRKQGRLAGVQNSGGISGEGFAEGRIDRPLKTSFSRVRNPRGLKIPPRG